MAPPSSSPHIVNWEEDPQGGEDAVSEMTQWQGLLAAEMSSQSLSEYFKPGDPRHWKDILQTVSSTNIENIVLKCGFCVT